MASGMLPALHAGSSPHGDTALFWLTVAAVMGLGVYSWLRHRH